MPGQRPAALTAFDRNVASLHQIAFEATAKVFSEPADDEKIANLARRMERLADKQIAQAQEASPDPIACRAGCSFCCFQQVLATVPEVINLAAYIQENWADEQISRLMDRIQAYKPAAEAYNSGASSAPPQGPCPLLQEDRCSAWPGRPLVCRGYNSVDVTFCERKLSEPTTPVPQLMTQRASSDAFQDGIGLAVQRRRLFPDQCDMILGLEIALTTPNAGQRFLAGEPLFAPAACRELRIAVASDAASPSGR